MPRAIHGEHREPLTRERVLRAAVELADDEGLEGLSMRRLASRLGVKAMSLYNHVANKDEILDGIVELLVDEIDVPPDDVDWRSGIRGRALSARRMAQAHPWAVRLLAARSPVSRGLMRYLDGVVGAFEKAGFANQLTHDALHLISSRMLGFTQDIFDPNGISPASAAAFEAEMRSGAYPHIVAALDGVTHDDEAEFAFGLDLILDGLERRRDGTTQGR
ncbi:MAG TPA: TetR/AcrR family transcriptional regulator C-terminal domain-containing protein [Candidatus Limnocylindrales bacterium]|nr:TetR/AcrR family transcriptional regulator C-terminal domain-containing protein [Candidatus Limnocylindrales bacterium]